MPLLPPLLFSLQLSLPLWLRSCVVSVLFSGNSLIAFYGKASLIHIFASRGSGCCVCTATFRHCVPDLTLFSGNANRANLFSLQALPCAGMWGRLVIVLGGMG
jgi:hypothetical protein